MDKGGCVVAHGIDDGTQVFRLAPMAVCAAMAYVDVIASITSGPVAGKIKISFVWREGWCGLPGLGIDAVPHVLRGAPSVGGEIRYIEVATAMTVGEIAPG